MRLAVIAPVYNEEVLLPHFLTHYCPQVDMVYLLDDGSTDGTAAIAARYKNTRLEPIHDDPAAANYQAIMAKRVACAGQYDYVIMVDVDEFIVPRYHLAGVPLAVVLAALPRRVCHKTLGYYMFPGPGEAPYSPNTPLLAQRRWGYHAPLYSKPCIVQPGSDAILVPGLHALAGGVPHADVTARPEFLLLHYSGPSEEIWVKRRVQAEGRRLAPAARKGPGWYGAQYRMECNRPELVQVVT